MSRSSVTVRAGVYLADAGSLTVHDAASGRPTLNLVGEHLLLRTEDELLVYEIRP